MVGANHADCLQTLKNREEAAAAAASRRVLIDLGWGDKAIAEQQHVHRATITNWRKFNSVKRPQHRKRTTGNKEVRELQMRIVKAIGRSLPPDLAADAAASLMLAVVEGTVSLNDIESRAAKFRSRTLQDYANSFAFSSLDQDITDHDGLRPIDLLVDEASSDWLQEMGATVH